MLNEGSENWDALCDLACHYGSALFTNASMLPFIDVKVKEHVPKQRAARKNTQQASVLSCTIISIHIYTSIPFKVEEKRPKQTDKLERKGEGSAAVNHVMKQIKTIYRASNNQPIPYYKLICNPHDFMESVQNAMIISFLLKENLISLATGEDGLPQITVNTSQVESSSEDSNQSICGLDVELCEVH